MRSYFVLPDGTKLKLLDRPRGIDDGLHTYVLNQTNTQSLQTLIGKTIHGDVSLLVGDYYSGRDTGSVMSWKLDIFGVGFDSSSDAGTDSSTADVSITAQIVDFFTSFFGDHRCDFPSDDCMPKMAGMTHENIFEGNVKKMATLNIGGVMTKDGKEGFIVAGHVAKPNTFPTIYHKMGFDIFGNIVFENTLGKIAIHSDSTIDAAFVEYPLKCDSVDSTLKTCVGSEFYVPTVEKKIYKGPGKSYDVVGSVNVFEGMNVKWFGADTRSEQSGIVSHDTPFDLPENKAGEIFKVIIIDGQESVDNDSGGPVYVINNLGKAEIVGLISAHDISPKYDKVFVTPWHLIETDLGLKPIS